MPRQIHIGNVKQIPKGEGRKFKRGDVEIAVFHARSGEVFATQPNCPHAGGPLADGLLGGASVVCPLHDRAFDLRTGKNLSGDCCDVRSFSVTLEEDGGIFVEMKA
jgi:nitrite reductase (NADH) small subunit